MKKENLNVQETRCGDSLTKNVGDSFLLIHDLKSNFATLFAWFDCLIYFGLRCLLTLLDLLRLLGLPGYNARLDLVDFTCPGLAAVS